MRDEPAAVQQTRGDILSADAPRLQRMIEVYATKIRKQWNLPVDAEPDLRACGGVGLAQAYATYDETRGAAFPTHAEHKIRGSIQHGARAMARALRIGAAFVARPEQDAGDRWERELDLYDEVVLGAMTSEMSPQPGENAEEKLLREERWEQVREAFATLPEQDQELLRALYIDDSDKRQADLAHELGIDESRLSHRKRDAHTRLAKQFFNLDRKRPRGA